MIENKFLRGGKILRNIILILIYFFLSFQINDANVISKIFETKVFAYKVIQSEMFPP